MKNPTVIQSLSFFWYLEGCSSCSSFTWDQVEDLVHFLVDGRCGISTKAVDIYDILILDSLWHFYPYLSALIQAVSKGLAS